MPRTAGMLEKARICELGTRLGNNQSITQEEAQALEDLTNAGYTVEFALIKEKSIGEWPKFRGQFGF